MARARAEGGRRLNSSMVKKSSKPPSRIGMGRKLSRPMLMLSKAISQRYWALVYIAISRAAVGVSSVLNMGQLLRHVADGYRGRVFSTIESVQWSVMMVSMALAGIASQHWDPR